MHIHVLEGEQSLHICGSMRTSPGHCPCRSGGGEDQAVLALATQVAEPTCVARRHGGRGLLCHPPGPTIQIRRYGVRLRHRNRAQMRSKSNNRCECNAPLCNVLVYLEPLLCASGFHRISLTCGAAEYESSNVTIIVLYDQISFEIDVRFSLRTSPGTVYSLEDILDAASAPPSASRLFQSSNPEQSARCAKTLRELLESYGQPALRGDDGFFEKMRIAKSDRAADLTRRVREDPVRAEAEAAWAQRDYVKVRQHYEAIAEHLNEVERGRLTYSRKMTESSGNS